MLCSCLSGSSQGGIRLDPDGGVFSGGDDDVGSGSGPMAKMGMTDSLVDCLLVLTVLLFLRARFSSFDHFLCFFSRVFVEE